MLIFEIKSGKGGKMVTRTNRQKVISRDAFGFARHLKMQGNAKNALILLLLGGPLFMGQTVAGHLLAFEAVKSMLEIVYPGVAASMKLNLTELTHALIQKRLMTLMKNWIH